MRNTCVKETRKHSHGWMNNAFFLFWKKVLIFLKKKRKRFGFFLSEKRRRRRDQRAKTMAIRFEFRHEEEVEEKSLLLSFCVHIQQGERGGRRVAIG